LYNIFKRWAYNNIGKDIRLALELQVLTKKENMKKIIFILLLIFSIGKLTYSQDAKIAKYKSMFTVNFIRYIGWPDEATKGNFVIGVLKDKIVTANLKQLTVGKKFGYQQIVIKEFKNLNEVTDCQILFVSKLINYSAKNSEIIKQKLNNKNSLIITNSEGATKKGAMINFIVRDGKLKFEVSPANSEQFGLKFSSSLTSLSNAIIK
jgi:hypothetical protein